MKKIFITTIMAICLTIIGISELKDTYKAKAASEEETTQYVWNWTPQPITDKNDIYVSLYQYQFTLRTTLKRGGIPQITLRRYMNNGNTSPYFTFDNIYELANVNSNVPITMVSTSAGRTYTYAITSRTYQPQTITESNNYNLEVQWLGIVVYATNSMESIRLTGIGADGTEVYAEIVRCINGNAGMPSENIKILNANSVVDRQTITYTSNEYIDVTGAYSNGWQSGYEEAYKNLYEPRYQAGYAVGLAEGAANANEYTFLGLLNAVFYAPLKAFVSMLNFEILGVNILTFVTALLTLAVVTTLIKVVL